MRQHEIVCTVTGEKESQYLQYIQDTINIFTVMHIEKCIHESGLSRQEQICVLEGLISNLKDKH